MTHLNREAMGIESSDEPPPEESPTKTPPVQPAPEKPQT